MRPPTPPSEEITTPEHPEVSHVAPEVVQSTTTTTAIETAKAMSAATPEVGTSAAKPAPWTEHVSFFLSSPDTGLVMYNLCWFRVLAALLPQPGRIGQAFCPTRARAGQSAHQFGTTHS